MKIVSFCCDEAEVKRIQPEDLQDKRDRQLGECTFVLGSVGADAGSLVALRLAMRK